MTTVRVATGAFGDQSATFTVPAYVLSVTITAVGSRGEPNGYVLHGGYGASVTGTVAVSPGDVIAATCGSSTFNNASNPYGGWRGGRKSTASLNGSLVIIAAGGGAAGLDTTPAGTSGEGGNGGYPTGAAGQSYPPTGAGTGATQSADGTNGASNTWSSGGEGVHNGGVGGSDSTSATKASGGGGGASWYAGSLTDVAASSSATSSNASNGYVDVTYVDPPSIPTITTPLAGSAVGDATPVSFQWRHNAPTTQAKANVQIRPSGGATTNYPVAGGTQSLAQTLTVGAWEWRVATYTANDQIGPYSAWIAFTVAVPPATPVITTPATGGTVTDASGSIVWTAPSQDVWQARVQYDGVTAWTSGEIPGAAHSVTGSYPINNAAAVVQVSVKYNDIWSAWASSAQTVAWVGPLAPEPFANPDPENGCIRIGWEQPAGATVPVRYVIAATENGVVTPVDSNVDPVDRTFTFWTPLSGVPTAIHVIAYAASGAFTEGTTGWSD